jgi:hypothetical protein
VSETDLLFDGASVTNTGREKIVCHKQATGGGLAIHEHGSALRSEGGAGL